MEESINGGRVIKVFNHEAAARADFERVNQSLYEASYQANRYSNTLMPILNNVSYLIYIIVAACGGLLLEQQVPNLSLSGLPFSLAVMVPFLGMSRQFATNIQMISPQINAMVMGLAGAERIFGLLDEKPEQDKGTVELRAPGRRDRYPALGLGAAGGQGAGRTAAPSGEKSISARWISAMKRASPSSGTFPWMPCPVRKSPWWGPRGPGRPPSPTCSPGSMIFPPAPSPVTGSPGTDPEGALRRSLGMVLQDTVLFTATVLENIRYGRLEATDEECVAAARLAGADDFIRHLPQGYHTVLRGAGAGLSQGQCQLLAIARAAVADPPVMILDEATSSIDTRTEQIVQRGMDALMEGRTVFVIAHRLSTVRNADQILVLDQGKIKERGTHRQLLEQKGMYWQLYTGAVELE